MKVFSFAVGLLGAVTMSETVTSFMQVDSLLNEGLSLGVVLGAGLVVGGAILTVGKQVGRHAKATETLALEVVAVKEIVHQNGEKMERHLFRIDDQITIVRERLTAVETKTETLR